MLEQYQSINPNKKHLSANTSISDLAINNKNNYNNNFNNLNKSP